MLPCNALNQGCWCGRTMSYRVSSGRSCKYSEVKPSNSSSWALMRRTVDCRCRALKDDSSRSSDGWYKGGAYKRPQDVNRSSNNGNGIVVKEAPSRLTTAMLQDVLAESIRKLTTYKEKMNKTETLMKEGRTQIQQLEHGLEEATRRKAELETKLGKQKKENKELQEEIGTAQNMIAGLEKSLAAEQAVCRQLDEEIKTARDLITKLDLKITQLEDAMAEARVVQVERDEELRSLQAIQQEEEEARLAAVAAASSSGHAHLKAPWPPTDQIVIFYPTNWKKTYIHYTEDGKKWTSLPGVPLKDTGAGVKLVTIAARKIEFCVNNGGGEWDSPGGNYRIDKPGVYRIERGRTERMALD